MRASFIRDISVSIRISSTYVSFITSRSFFSCLFIVISLKELSVNLTSKLLQDFKGTEYEEMAKGNFDFAVRHKVR